MHTGRLLCNVIVCCVGYVSCLHVNDFEQKNSPLLFIRRVLSLGRNLTGCLSLSRNFQRSRISKFGISIIGPSLWYKPYKYLMAPHKLCGKCEKFRLSGLVILSLDHNLTAFLRGIFISLMLIPVTFESFQWCLKESCTEGIVLRCPAKKTYYLLLGTNFLISLLFQSLHIQSLETANSNIKVFFCRI